MLKLVSKTDGIGALNTWNKSIEIFQILILSLALYAVCTPLDEASPSNGHSVAIQPNPNTEHPTNGNAEKTASTVNSKHLSRRGAASAEAAKPTPAPHKAPAISADHKERKSRDTAAPNQSRQSDNVNEKQQRSDTLHKNSERPKRQLLESQDHPNNSQESQRRQPTQPKSDQNSRSSRSTADQVPAKRTPNSSTTNVKKDAKPKPTSNSQKH